MLGSCVCCALLAYCIYHGTESGVTFASQIEKACHQSSGDAEIGTGSWSICQDLIFGLRLLRVLESSASQQIDNVCSNVDAFRLSIMNHLFYCPVSAFAAPGTLGVNVDATEIGKIEAGLNAWVSVTARKSHGDCLHDRVVEERSGPAMGRFSRVRKCHLFGHTYIIAWSSARLY
jgi:hypothetical protein